MSQLFQAIIVDTNHYHFFYRFRARMQVRRSKKEIAATQLRSVEQIEMGNETERGTNGSCSE